VARAVPPTTVAPMPPPVAPTPRSRGVRRVMAFPRQRVLNTPVLVPEPISPQESTKQSVASQTTLVPVMLSVASQSTPEPDVIQATTPAPVAIPSPAQRTVAQQPAQRSRGRVRQPVGHGVDTAIWGPSAWYILHTLAELASATESGIATRWRSFIEAVAVSIPCPTCARHFRIWMGWVPFEESVDAATVRARFAELHNMVNRTNKVPEWSGDLAATYTGSADDVRARIATMRGIIGAPMLDAAEEMLSALGT
jgi:hypothetical protein